MILAAAVSALVAGAAPHTPAKLAGLYETSQMEMGGALELQPGGHFRYQLEYGAASEEAEGDWTFDGTTVRLTSNPMPSKPAFALVSDEPAPAGDLYVAVEDSRFGIWTPLTVVVTADGFDRPIKMYAEDDGRVIAPNGQRVTSVRMLLPVYESGGDPVQLSADRGHRLLFRIQPNDLGKAPLQSEPLDFHAGSLVMHRYDTEITFRRARR